MAKKKISDKRIVWLLVIVVIGIIFSSIIVGFIFTIGESEFQTSLVGMKIGPTTKTQGAFKWDYIDYETDSDRTQDYSTWQPDKHLNNYATHQIDKYNWNIDPDFSVYGCPNVMASILGEYYPTDATGKKVNEFQITPMPVTFYDPDGIEWIMSFYRTFIGTQLTITVAGGKDITPYTYLGTDYIDIGALAETPTTYNSRHGSVIDQSFIGNGVDFSIVIRNQIKEWKIGESTHSDPYLLTDNAFLWASIGDITTNIESTAGWMYGGDFTGNLINQANLVMYPTCKDALLGTNQLSDIDVDDIELGDILYDTVYTSLDYEVKLGANWNTEGVNEWALYEQEYNGMELQGWQVLVNIFFCVTTAFMFADFGYTQMTTIVNPFLDPDVIPKNFWDWFSGVWQTGWGKFLIIGFWVIIAIAIGYVFFVYILPILKTIRTTKKAMGK